MRFLLLFLLLSLPLQAPADSGVQPEAMISAGFGIPFSANAGIGSEADRNRGKENRWPAVPLSELFDSELPSDGPEEMNVLQNSRQPLTLDELRDTPVYTRFIVDNLWVLIASFMVFIMHLGFASVESGFTQTRHSVNVIYKNLFILCTGFIVYALVGFRIMYPVEFNGFFGFDGFGIGFEPDELIGSLRPGTDTVITVWTYFIYQAMFAATAATIVSGCVTGRIKLGSFMLFGALLVGISYPVTGSWSWGGGWLSDLGFYDFAGSTIVHGVGGTAGLVCAILVGPREGKYKDGMVRHIPPHSIPLITLGIFLLWFGWLGFNGGSVHSADPVRVPYVFVTTTLGACTACLTSMAATHLIRKRLDAPVALTGVLAGLVSVTAGADVVTPIDAVVIGGIAGILADLSVKLIDRLGVDDPVSAISVHGVCGVWGTIAVALFTDQASLLVQLAGIGSILGTTFVFSFLVFGAIRKTVGVRVTRRVERIGLDIAEHGNRAYPDMTDDPREESAPSTNQLKLF